MRHAEPAARLGQLIQQTRQSRNLSLRRLSSMSGVAHTTILKIERGGIARPRPDVLTALAQALEIPIADLFVIVSYSSPHDLPSFAPYLRARYRDLPPETINDLVAYFENLTAQEGIRLDGPPNKEDEQR